MNMRVVFKVSSKGMKRRNNGREKFSFFRKRENRLFGGGKKTVS